MIVVVEITTVEAPPAKESVDLLRRVGRLCELGALERRNVGSEPVDVDAGLRRHADDLRAAPAPLESPPAVRRLRRRVRRRPKPGPIGRRRAAASCPASAGEASAVVNTRSPATTVRTVAIQALHRKTCSLNYKQGRYPRYRMTDELVDQVAGGSRSQAAVRSAVSRSDARVAGALGDLRGATGEAQGGRRAIGRRKAGRLRDVLRPAAFPARPRDCSCAGACDAWSFGHCRPRLWHGRSRRRMGERAGAEAGRARHRRQRLGTRGGRAHVARVRDPGAGQACRLRDDGVAEGSRQALVAAFAVNELQDPSRASLLERLLDGRTGGSRGSAERLGGQAPVQGGHGGAGGKAPVLIVEPLARAAAPWWPTWRAGLRARRRARRRVAVPPRAPAARRQARSRGRSRPPRADGPLAFDQITRSHSPILRGIAQLPDSPSHYPITRLPNPITQPPITQSPDNASVVENPAHPAATVILLRDAPEGPEIFMVRRNAVWLVHGGAARVSRRPRRCRRSPDRRRRLVRRCGPGRRPLAGPVAGRGDCVPRSGGTRAFRRGRRAAGTRRGRRPGLARRRGRSGAVCRPSTRRALRRADARRPDGDAKRCGWRSTPCFHGRTGSRRR